MEQERICMSIWEEIGLDTIHTSNEEELVQGNIDLDEYYTNIDEI